LKWENEFNNLTEEPTQSDIYKDTSKHYCGYFDKPWCLAPMSIEYPPLTFDLEVPHIFNVQY